MSQTFTASSYLLRQEAIWLANFITAGTFFRLYQNDYVPNPLSPLYEFAECDFPGYAAVELGAQFGLPIQTNPFTIQIGPVYALQICSGGSGQVAYGWYISNLGNLFFAGAFATPINFANGSNASFEINLWEQAP
jgi:hypothetical protein